MTRLVIVAGLCLAVVVLIGAAGAQMLPLGLKVNIQNAPYTGAVCNLAVQNTSAGSGLFVAGPTQNIFKEGC